MKRSTIGLTAGALLLAAGCSGEAGGQAEPTGGPNSATSSATASSSVTESNTSSKLPHSGAPKVNDPLPEAVLDAHPCDAALTQQQVDEALGEDGVQQKRADTGAGPGCDWSDPERFSSIMVGYGTATGQGLSAHYKNTQPQSAVFEATDPVGGLPAVKFQPSVGSDFCTTAVGLSDEYAITVGVTLGRGQEGSDPCKGAARVAQDVVGNLKGKA